MKNIIKSTAFLAVLGGFFSLMLEGCALDYENTKAINPQNVWENKTMIDSYLTDIYGMLPGWPVNNGNNTDEALNKAGSLGDWARGIIGVEVNTSGFNYEYIDKINFMLEQLEDVPETVLTETENQQIKGQALFWRAWDYFGKIRTFGGVPLVLKSQTTSDYESLFIPRNKTSECVEQIIKDLDEAISYLPGTWDDTNYGRIDKGCAMAFKGRVLLWWASPLFNPSNDKQRWQTAYEANKAAVEFLKSVGKGLYPDFTRIWKDEQNEEVVMVNQYYYPDHKTSQNAVRPEPLTKDNANNDQPILQLLLAFPQRDGSPLTLDKERLASDAEYNADFLERFYNNRDDRFHTTVFCGGTQYPSADRAAGGILSGNQSYWCTWRKLEEGSFSSMVLDQISKGVGDGISGFFKAKGIDETLDRNTVSDGGTDWVEIRFAEVLMNYGECANEIGNTGEALDVLYQIRKRAGIEAGNGRYGITASSQDEIREAYVNERFVEFAFEGMRSGDLKRWKRWGMLNEMKHRHGLYIVLNNNEDVKDFAWTWNIRDKEVMQKFHAEYIENLDGNDDYFFNYNLNYWFNPIKKDDMDRNSKLEQNIEWGGTFDPYQ